MNSISSGGQAAADLKTKVSALETKAALERGEIVVKNGYKIVGLVKGDVITEDCRVFAQGAVTSSRVPRWVIGLSVPEGRVVFRRVQL